MPDTTQTFFSNNHFCSGECTFRLIRIGMINSASCLPQRFSSLFRIALYRIFPDSLISRLHSSINMKIATHAAASSGAAPASALARCNNSNNHIFQLTVHCLPFAGRRSSVEHKRAANDTADRKWRRKAQ